MTFESMMDRLTDNARGVLAEARRASLRLNHEHIDVEHLLLGIVDHGMLALAGSKATRILVGLGTDPVLLKKDISGRLRSGRWRLSPGSPPFTPEAKRTLEIGFEEALNLGHRRFGTEHLLLGLVRGRGLAADVLEAHGITAEEVRSQLKCAD